MEVEGLDLGGGYHYHMEVEGLDLGGCHHHVEVDRLGLG